MSNPPNLCENGPVEAEMQLVQSLANPRIRERYEFKLYTVHSAPSLIPDTVIKTPPLDLIYDTIPYHRTHRS